MSILTMGKAHRGTVANIATYDVSSFRTRVHEYVHMDPMIQPYVELASFGHISKILSWSIDNKFILALCERWRPETHIFWFPTGECTVTLEDVYMLLGLSIEGKAVNGKTNYANSICMELLETDLLDDNARGQVMPTEEKPSRTYMAWYRSVGFQFIAEDMYLYDPRQMTYTPDTSTSNPQQ
ncbi:hypothetical protein KIW84_015574 [Lathyrus oleraceus]|uniref:Aminotransferase-like plant mobile domain-containing protein n=1 Tax=Pisum sativum TaxID=3888 RepID=A0A9D5H0V2_PEA|nr:hypothetical protein KIW84_015574 [Pisum sativum]